MAFRVQEVFGTSEKRAKFTGLEPRRCEDIKRLVAPEIGPKSFGAFEKQAPDKNRCSTTTNPRERLPRLPRSAV